MIERHFMSGTARALATVLTAVLALGTAQALAMPATASAAAVPTLQGVAAASALVRRSCAGHGAEYGDWVSGKRRAGGITRIQLRDCEAVQRCTGDICMVSTDSGWKMRAYGKCGSKECSWGWSAGAHRTKAGVPARYRRGAVTQYVTAKAVPRQPKQLKVRVKTDYTDPARRDQVTTAVYKRKTRVRT